MLICLVSCANKHRNVFGPVWPFLAWGTIAGRPRTMSLGTWTILLHGRTRRAHCAYDSMNLYPLQHECTIMYILDVHSTHTCIRIDVWVIYIYNIQYNILIDFILVALGIWIHEMSTLPVSTGKLRRCRSWLPLWSSLGAPMHCIWIWPCHRDMGTWGPWANCANNKKKGFANGIRAIRDSGGITMVYIGAIDD